MGIIKTTSTYLVDTGIGPVSVTNSEIENYDIDDFVHSTVRSQCITLQLINAIQVADPALAKNRPPLNLNGHTIGGF